MLIPTLQAPSSLPQVRHVSLTQSLPCHTASSRTLPCPPLPPAALVDAVKGGGGEALIFSSMHVSGEQLDKMTGVAALLRFPLPDLEDAELPDPTA